MLRGNGSDADGAVRAGEGGDHARLRGWKEIGRYFGVDERTVKRWEVQRGMPVHRVPGELKAPVFAYSHELKTWVESNSRATSQAAEPQMPGGSAPDRRSWPQLSLLLLVALAAIALFLGLRASDDRREAANSAAELKRLAGAQVAALNDQLDSQPGTVAVRASLAKEAVEILGRVAAADSSADLRQEAAEGYRRLAILQNAVDRPSLRDRSAALQSLKMGLGMIDGDAGPEADVVRARLLIEASRQAGGGGDLAEATRMLAEAERLVLGQGHQALLDEWWVARSEYLGWTGDNAASLAAARRVSHEPATDPVVALRQFKAKDQEAEALYYLGEVEAARAIYAQLVSSAEEAATRWPHDNRIRWGLLRQKWNLGSTLIEVGRPRDAKPILSQSLDGWRALAAADPSDEAVQAWVRATRLSLGQALAASGEHSLAIAELSTAVAERRDWHAHRPADADRRRMLMKSLATLADTLAFAGRQAEACRLYAEATGLGNEMATAGQLTGFDKAETLRKVGDAQARFCV